AVDNCPTVANAAQADTDGDRLGDTCETGLYGTDPNNADTDADQCRDGVEVLTMQFSPGQGGSRNPLNHWDFYDVNATGKIDAVDIALVRSKFTGGSPTPPSSMNYDRS